MIYFYWQVAKGVFYRFEYFVNDYQSYIVARAAAYASVGQYCAPRVISVNH